MKYDFILIDADDTLFDFQKTAEKNFEETCKILGVPYKDGYYEIYRDINQNYWDLFSLGKVEKSVLKKMRFVDFGKAIGFDINADEFMPIYENGLAKISILFPETLPVLTKLKNMGLKIPDEQLRTEIENIILPLHELIEINNDKITIRKKIITIQSSINKKAR